MPDYLGKDQRKVRGDEEKDDKPIQGIFVERFVDTGASLYDILLSSLLKSL